MTAATNDQHGAYTSRQRNNETPRETEARALLSCASRLERARGTEVSKEEYAEAVQHNQQLWTIFQVCLCEPDNQLPKDLKDILLNLSQYVDKASFRAMSGHNPDILRSLININRNIAAGLSVNPAAASVGEAASASMPSPAGQPQSVTTTA